MIRVRPFPGVRPVPDKAKAVVSPPYDVLDSNEARQMAEGNPYSFLRVSKPEIEFDQAMDPYDPRVYRRGTENIRRLMTTGVLIQDGNPCFYLYTLRMGDHTQTGLVAVASVDDYEQNRIRKHEHTRPEKEIDRARIINELDGQIEPVFLTYRAASSIDDLLKECLQRPPVYDFVADYGVQHVFRVIDDERHIEALQKAFLAIEALYVADGHHRSAAAARVRETRRADNPGHTGEEPYNFFLAVIFPHAQLHILDYNRVVKDLGAMSVDAFLNRVERGQFRLSECASSHSGQGQRCGPLGTHTFGMYLKGRWYRLEAKPGSYDESDPIARLDVSILQNNLLAPLLGITDPRTDRRIHFVGGIRGLGELERLVDSGQHAVAFALFPTSIDQLLEVADAGQVMPPKSTWFEPKLGSGIIIHML